jgi:hypothetical protein
MVMIYESKKIPVWQNVIHRKLTWSINALRAIQQINADDWDDSAANTICEIAKAGYFFGLPDCDDDILELCELSGKKYPEQIATALKYIVAISPFSGIVEEAINLLVKKAVYDNNKFAWDVICSMIDALTSMVEIYQSLGKKYSPELTERINTLIKIKDRQQNCIITSKIDKRTISNSLTTVLIQANDIFDNIYYRELYCIELLGSRKSYFANS